MGQLFNSISEVKKNYRVYDQWEQAQADEKAKKQYLAKNLDIPKDEVELTRQKAETVIRASEMLDKRSENNCEDMEQATGIAAALAALVPSLGSAAAQAHLMMKSGNKKAIAIARIVGAVGTLAIGIAAILIGNSKQKEASRIGRFQAKENELKDVKNFVMYTPEQIKAAEERAKDVPDVKEKKENIFSIFSNVGQIFKDKKAYLEHQAQKDPELIDKLKKENYTPEQLAQGAKDCELIVDTVKDINIRAEEYSENLENVFDTMEIFSFVAAVPIAFGINKLLKAFKVSKAIAPIVSFTTGFLAPIAIAIWGTQEQKVASRIGRYHARQELLKDPAALMHFTDEQKAQAQNITAPKQKKNFFAKLGENFKFLGTYFGDKKGWKKYNNETRKTNEKVLEELKKSDISDTQMQNAKHTQEKLYLAFDEVDEMSQRYSEDTEAATEIAKQVVSSAWSIGSLAALAMLPVMFMKGKLPIDKIVKGIANLSLDNSSKIRTLVNDGANILKSNPNLRKQALKDLGKLKFDAIKESDLLKPVVSGLGEEAVKITATGDVAKGLGPHFKKGWFAKWVRNLVGEGFKLKSKKAMSQFTDKGIPIPDAMLEKTKFNFNNYPTMFKTAAVAGIPLLGIIVGVPYAFNAWLTNIQKKAGKIGIMKAMSQLDDPRVFVDANVQPAQPAAAQNQAQNQAQPTVPVSSTNLLAKYKK